MEEKQLVSIGREDIEDTEINGVIIKESEQLLMMQEVYDFSLDGLKVIRQQDISEISQFNTDIFQTDRLKALGLYDKIPFEPSYDITNWQSFFETARADFNFFTVQDEENEIFNLGEVKEIQSDKIIMQTCEGVGNWHDTLTEIPYENISSVQIGSRYSKVYEDFMMSKEI